jgi:hypothetical protein
MWSVVRSMLGVTWNPTSTLEFLEILHSFTGETKRFLWVYFATQSWGLWLIRNKYTIESKFPRQPAESNVSYFSRTGVLFCAPSQSWWQTRCCACLEKPSPTITRLQHQGQVETPTPIVKLLQFVWWCFELCYIALRGLNCNRKLIYSAVLCITLIDPAELY